MDYYSYTTILTAASLSGFLSSPFWGKMIDKYGNVKIIKITARLMPLIPLLWLLSKNILYLTLANTFASYLWTGFALAVPNYIFDIASPETRTRCLSYYNFTVGIAIFLGAIFSGFLITYVPGVIFGSKYLTMLFLSGVGRWVSDFIFIDKFHEVREVDKIEDKDMLFAIIGLPNDFSFITDFHTKFSPIKNIGKLKHFIEILFTKNNNH